MFLCELNLYIYIYKQPNNLHNKEKDGLLQSSDKNLNLLK